MAELAARCQGVGGSRRGAVRGLNIASAEADLKNWKGNLEKAGFLPEERAWVADRLSGGWVDVMRTLHPRGHRPVQLVELARPGLRQRCRLADRLPAGHRRAGRLGDRRRHRTPGRLRAALVRPRAGHRRVRPAPGRRRRAGAA